MHQWNGQQRALAIKMFYKNSDSFKAAQREFRRFYNLGRHGAVPSKHAITNWINNFEETGSALKKNQQDDQEVLVLHRTLMLYTRLSYEAHGVQFVSKQLRLKSPGRVFAEFFI